MNSMNPATSGTGSTMRAPMTGLLTELIHPEQLATERARSALAISDGDVLLFVQEVHKTLLSSGRQ